ncbi:MAG: hypothetical protein QOG54_111 [Actinomycetota bacterium]|jgi:excisionase family DNA binding protein|nr:hypothetical protein [Actinomycetota bacterium]
MAKESAPSAPQVEARFWNLDDVAAYLSVSVPQVYALVRSGELPAVKIGGRGIWRVDRRKLDDYLEKLETQTAEWAKKHPLNPKDKAGPGAEELE